MNFPMNCTPISLPSNLLVSLIISASMTAQAKFTGIMSVPFMMAILGFKVFSSFFGGTRWIRMAPGPSGFRVV